MEFAENRDLFSDYQAAFRRNKRCEDLIVALEVTCSICKTKKMKTYLGFLTYQNFQYSGQKYAIYSLVELWYPRQSMEPNTHAI